MKNETLLLKKIYFKPPVRSFNLKVRRWVTDVQGVIIDKNLLPAALQQKMPFFMFGKNDMKGGLRSGLSTLPPLGGWQFLTTFINQSPFSTYNVTGFTGLSNVQGQILSGDIVHVYTDSLTAPNYYVWMVQTNPGGAMGSVLESTKNFEIDYWNYLVDTAFQFEEKIFPITTNGLGVKSSDGFNPLQFRTTDILLPNILKLQWPFKIINELSLGSYMLFECDQIDFSFVFKY